VGGDTVNIGGGGTGRCGGGRVQEKNQTSSECSGGGEDLGKKMMEVSSRKGGKGRASGGGGVTWLNTALKKKRCPDRKIKRVQGRTTAEIGKGRQGAHKSNQPFERGKKILGGNSVHPMRSGGLILGSDLGYEREGETWSGEGLKGTMLGRFPKGVNPTKGFPSSVLSCVGGEVKQLYLQKIGLNNA